MLPQAPEFDRFLRPCPIGQPHAGCTMGPGLRRDGVICSEGAMKANWITASKAGTQGARAELPWAPAFAGETIVLEEEANEARRQGRAAYRASLRHGRQHGEGLCPRRGQG